MNILQLIVVVMVLYLGGMLAVGFYGKKYANSFEDYLTAAKQGTFLMVCGSYSRLFQQNKVPTESPEMHPA